MSKLAMSRNKLTNLPFLNTFCIPWSIPYESTEAKHDNFFCWIFDQESKKFLIF